MLSPLQKGTVKNRVWWIQECIVSFPVKHKPNQRQNGTIQISIAKAPMWMFHLLNQSIDHRTTTLHQPYQIYGTEPEHQPYQTCVLNNFINHVKYTQWTKGRFYKWVAIMIHPHLRTRHFSCLHCERPIGESSKVGIGASVHGSQMWNNWAGKWYWSIHSFEPHKVWTTSTWLLHIVISHKNEDHNSYTVYWSLPQNKGRLTILATRLMITSENIFFRCKLIWIQPLIGKKQVKPLVL